MGPVKLCFEHRAPNADRSQIVSMSSKGRSQEKRRRLSSNQGLGSACISQGVALPVLQREQGRLRAWAVGRYPAGCDIPPASKCCSGSPEVLMGVEGGRSRGGQSEEATMDMHGVRDNKKWP